MALLPRTRVPRPWLPWAKGGLAVVLVIGAGYGLLELAQRALGLRRLTIEQVAVTGTRGERQTEIQQLAEQKCLHKPLFWFDADGLRSAVEAKRWVRGLLIRKEPPDRLTLVIEERKPLLWLVRGGATYLMSDDGIVMDRLNGANMSPIPVVADPASQNDRALAELISAARVLRDRQPGFYERMAELRWSSKGPVAYIEGFQAPIFLSRANVANNIPNFQAIFVDELMKRPDFAKIPYVDLRWGNDDYIAVGATDSNATPVQKAR
ncbi:MAG TPA: FtsQ-type POTRA domain-containing protein [Holophagaceae bacterium]|nr:FtsQ-type POTRA domain-containing protein [Holophagaceae bacterium]